MPHARAFLAVLLLAACGSGAESEDPSRGEVETADVAAVAGGTEASQAIETVPAPEGSLAAEDMTMGQAGAPIEIVEYASVTCPACAAFHAQYLPLIKEQLVETGEATLTFREFPTNPVRLSYAGSILARCAATDTGAPAFFTMLDALYARQRDWAYGANPSAVLEEIFGQAGLDRAAIETCLRREDILSAVNANVEAGTEDGVQGTPTLIVNGEPYDFRGKSPEELVEALRAEAGR